MERRRRTHRRSGQHPSSNDAGGSGSRHHGGPGEAPHNNHPSEWPLQPLPPFQDDDYQEFLTDWNSRQSPSQLHPGQHWPVQDDSWSPIMTSLPTHSTTVASSSPVDYRAMTDLHQHLGHHAENSPGYHSMAPYYSPPQQYAAAAAAAAGSTSQAEMPALPAAAWGPGVYVDDPGRPRRSVGYRPLSNWFGLWLPEDEENLREGNDRDSDSEEGSDRERRRNREDRDRGRSDRGDRARSRRNRPRGRRSGSRR